MYCIRCITSLSHQILASEVDSPERLKLAVSELEDYPPRIVLSLSPTGQSPAPVLLKVMGMKTECSFSIDNDQCESLTAQQNQLL